MRASTKSIHALSAACTLTIGLVAGDWVGTPTAIPSSLLTLACRTSGGAHVG